MLQYFSDLMSMIWKTEELRGSNIMQNQEVNWTICVALD